MDVFEAISGRHSYRGKYEDEKVPREALIEIMKAGLAAPSGCNAQTTSIIAVDDPEILRELNAVKNRPVGETAPAMICVLSRKIPSYHGNCYSVQDYSAAIENMLLAIVAMGYESCWIEGYVTDSRAVSLRMAEILGVPDEYELVCCLPVGRAAEPVKEVGKLPFEQRAWFNRFKGE